MAALEANVAKEEAEAVDAKAIAVREQARRHCIRMAVALDRGEAIRMAVECNGGRPRGRAPRANRGNPARAAKRAPTLLCTY